MDNQTASSSPESPITRNASLLGFYTAISTTILTIITLGIAFCTPPLSGPYCRGTPFEYPFLDIISRFPRDYYWMYPAILVSLLFVILIVCIHHYAPRDKKVFSQVALCFAVISASMLVMDYFVQISVIQPSLLNGETDGISILSQYNPHGIFIALEELGYLMMGFAFLFAAPVFSKTDKLEKAVRRIFITGFILAIAVLVIYSASYGIHREYRFEVAVITIDWMVLIVSSLVLSFVFKRQVT